MKSAHSIARSVLIWGAAIAGVLVLAAAARTPPGYAQSGAFTSQSLAAIPTGRHSASWKGGDLSVSYTYTRYGRRLDISGTARFANSATCNDAGPNGLFLNAVFADANGNPIETRRLSVERSDYSPIPFNSKLIVPPNAAGVAFTYENSAGPCSG